MYDWNNANLLIFVFLQKTAWWLNFCSESNWASFSEEKCLYFKLSLDDWTIDFWEPIPFIEPSTTPSHKMFMADMSEHLIPFYLITFITKSFQVNEIITKAKG